MQAMKDIQKIIEVAFETAVRPDEFKWVTDTIFDGTDEGCDFRGSIITIDTENVWASELYYAADYIDYNKEKRLTTLKALFKAIVFDEH